MKYSMPAEWLPHDACWVAWPSHADLWGEELPDVQAEFVAFCRAIAYAPPGATGENLHVLVPDIHRLPEAKERLAGLPVTFHQIGFGDIWLRDTGPIFVRDAAGTLTATCFQFNGWGAKYDLPFDKDVGHQIAHASRIPRRDENWVLEGGSIEVDGEGTCLTTEQCLLNPNRNPGLSREQIEKGLSASLGIRKTLWLGDGLLNDHTDGHIDTIARFTAPGKVVCMHANGSDDPNRAILKDIEDRLRAFRDAEGRTLEVTTVPSPGLVEADGKILAASYVNFYISNHSVVVPTYGVDSDAAAVKAIGALFPGRKAIGATARTLLTGGGAFHCITQQQPTAKGELV